MTRYIFLRILIELDRSSNDFHVSVTSVTTALQYPGTFGANTPVGKLDQSKVEMAYAYSLIGKFCTSMQGLWQSRCHKCRVFCGTGAHDIIKSNIQIRQLDPVLSSRIDKWSRKARFCPFCSLQLSFKCELFEKAPISLIPCINIAEIPTVRGSQG